MNTLFLRLLSIITCLSALAPLYAQTSLSYHSHQLREDEFTMKILPYHDAGCHGAGMTWDFSIYEDNMSSKSLPIALYEKGDSVLWDHSGQMLTYMRSAEGYSICRIETPLLEIDYPKAISTIHFPFCYGMNISDTFSGIGVYDNRLNLCENGIVSTAADGYGTLIMAEQDTVLNTLRVHTLLRSTLEVAAKETEEHQTTMQRTCDIYDWYAEYCPFPILRIYNETLDCEGKCIRQDCYTLRMEREARHHKKVSDADCEDILLDTTTPLINNITVTSNSAQALIEYDILTDTDVSIILSDSRGIVYYRSEFYESAGTGCQHQVPLSNLFHGQYVIYVRAGEEISAHSITIE